MTEINYEDVFTYTRLFINQFCILDKSLWSTGDDLRYAWFMFMQHHVYGSEKWLIRENTIIFDFDKMLKEIAYGLMYYKASDIYKGIHIKVWPLDEELSNDLLISYRITVLKDEEMIRNFNKSCKQSFVSKVFKCFMI